MSWAHYLIQVNIYLVVFYGFYRLLLDKETYFVLNRIYLISAGLFSLSIPFLRFEWFTRQEAVQPVYVGVDQFNQFIIQTGVIQQTPDQLTASNVVVAIYICGVLFFFGKLVYQLFRIQVLLRRSDSGSAFSFLKKKIVDNALPQAGVIDRHEEIHIKQLHTVDVLFFEFIGIIAWFNPVVYFYKSTVKNVHEFLADEAAANFQGDKKQYALLLLSNAFGVEASNLTNSFFNKSLIKKRIYMLHKQRSKRTAFIKYGLFLPLFAITLVMSSATIRNNEKLLKVAEDLPVEEPLIAVKNAVAEAVKPFVSEKMDLTRPEVTGYIQQADVNWRPFYTHLMKSVRYPAAAQETNLQGYTQVLFTVNDGKVQDVQTGGPKLGGGTDEEVLRVVKSFTGYNAIPTGKYSVKLVFTLSGEKADPALVLKNKDISNVEGYTALPSEVVIRGYQTVAGSPGTKGELSEVVVNGNAASANSGGKVYDFVSLDRAPSFPGGFAKFYEYLKTSLRYPEEAKANKTQGKVFLSFIVETDGELSDIRVDRRLGSGTDEEAVRVLASSPKWIPGMKDGNAVRVKFNIPISFSLVVSNEIKTVNITNLLENEVQGLPVKNANPAISQQDAKVYSFVSLEKQPEFVGGMSKFYEYLKKTVKYPTEAYKSKVEGKVFLSFVVEKDGSLTDINVDRKAGHGFDEEAVRVMKESPKWNPGVQGGKVVRVKYNIPISFSLAK